MKTYSKNDFLRSIGIQMNTAIQRNKNSVDSLTVIPYIKTLAHPASALLLSLLLVTFSSFADETQNTTNASASENADIDPCDDSAITACSSDSPSPDSGPSNAQPTTVVGNPISLVTGNKYQRERDYVIGGSVLEFSRNYNSARTDYSNGLGQGWSATFGSKIKNIENGGHKITDSSGRTFTFDEPGTEQDGATIFRSSSASHGHVAQSGNRSTWFMPDGRKLAYQGSFLVRIDYPGNQSLALFYQNKRLAEVTDNLGRVLKFEYYESQAGLTDYSSDRFKEIPGYLKRIILPDSSKVEYDYDDNRNLTRVRFDDGTSTEYHYEDEVYPNHLTGITDRLGNRYASWEYNDHGLATLSEHAGGVERVTLKYEMPENESAVGTTYVTNSLDKVSVYRWQRIHPSGEILLLSSDGPGCTTCPPANMTYSYTADHLLATSSNLNGKTKHYFYDDNGRIEKIERTTTDNPVPVLEERYEYKENGVRPVRIFRPSVNSNGEYEIAITYNSESLPLEITESGFAPIAPSIASKLANLYKPITRTTKLSYEAGRLSTVDGPRDDVDDITSFHYDQLGRLSRMDLPSGEVITIDEYDQHARAVKFQRADHPQVSLQYDRYGNVSRITQLGQSVDYVYNAENRLTSVTNPNGKTSTLSYDQAQRLTSVSDDLGRTVALTFNTESQEQTRTFLGVNGSLINSLNYVFDAEGRIQSVTEEQIDNSNNKTLSSTTEVKYDSFGQPVGARDKESGREISFVFSELGRMLQSSEPNGLSEQHKYDTHNRLIAHTDRRFNTTRYHRDDFGHVHFLESQDTGITQYNYDSAGNRIKKTNADGDVTRYQWDAANRLVEQVDIDGKTSYTYHSQNGRLIETNNPSITERYTYTKFAQLETHTRHIDDHAFTTKYIYAANGKLRNKILPDGQTLRYHYHESGPNAHTLRAITREELLGLRQSTLLGEIDLDWRDGQTGYLSHNGRRNNTQYHADGKVSSVSVEDTLTLQYEYDKSGNIVGIRQDGIDQRFAYSASQLTQANTLTGDYNYAYDVTGNRKAASASGSSNDYELALNYVTVSKGNRLEGWLENNTDKAIDYRYNQTGSPIAIGELRYEYNANQRPVKVTRSGKLVAEYSYNSFGERIKKVTYSQNQKKVTYFLYDQRTLVAEIDGETLKHKQTVYLKHTPVAYLVDKTAYAVHTDNIGTPKLLTNNHGDTVWKAAHTPLGQALIERQDIQFNLRLPGQYADNETGTHYNYLRDYDPQTGRYLTSDPVGLEGGDNTYAYAKNNVLGAIDVLGLSSQVAGLPENLVSNGNNAEPFTLSSANNPAQNPSEMATDVTDQNIIDPNHLVTEFLTIGSPCDSDIGTKRFNESLADLASQGLLAGTEAREIVEQLRKDHGLAPGDELVLIALENWHQKLNDEWIGFEETSLLAIPYCTKDENMPAVIQGALGKLVQPGEIAAIVASLGEPDAKGCRPAGIVDVTDLHEEVLRRFEIKLATDPRVVTAEKELLLAQEAFDNFIRLNGDLEICMTSAPYQGGYIPPLCSEYEYYRNAVEDAASRLARTLTTVYDEQVNAGLLPPETAAAKKKRRKQIMLSVLGIFIPLTPEDAAVEAVMLAATSGFGKIASVFDGIGDLVRLLIRGERAGIDEFITSGAEATRRINEIKMKAYRDFPSFAEMDYADVVRIEAKVGMDNLGKLQSDLANTPGLANAFKNNPDLADAWKIINDIGGCSFDGSTVVITEQGLKPISQLQIGLDRVLARDEQSGDQQYKNILAKYSNQYSEKVVIGLTNDKTGEQISVVSNKIHPIFVKSSNAMLRVASEGYTYLGNKDHGEWVDASDLLLGDQLQNDDRTWSTVTSIEISEEKFTAFNLTVEDFNTYFVGEKGKTSTFWVHNTCPGANKEILQAIAAKPELGDTYKFLYGSDNAARQFPDIRNNPAALQKVHELRGDADFVAKVGGEDELRKIIESQMRPLVVNATSDVTFTRHMDNVKHFIDNHLDESIPGSEKVLADMKNPNWTTQEGLHHMLEGISKHDAGTIDSIDMRFTDGCDTNCRFDVKLNDGTLIEYKNVQLSGVSNITGNQLSTYFGNTDSITKLQYVFNKKKIESDPDFPGGDAVDVIKSEMQKRLNNPTVMQDIYNNIKNKAALLRELNLPEPSEFELSDLENLINDTDSELYSFIKAI